MSSYNVIILASFENTLIVEKTRKVQFISRLVIERDDGAPWSYEVLMGTGSSICYSDTDVAEYSPAYLGQIYAGVILNSARTTSTGYKRGQGRYSGDIELYIISTSGTPAPCL